MLKILFVSQKNIERQICGVYLIGERYFNALAAYSDHAIYRSLASSMPEIMYEIEHIQPNIVLVNFHIITENWLRIQKLKKTYPHVKFAKIEHDFTQEKINSYNYIREQNYQYALCFDTSLQKTNENVFLLDRMLVPGTQDNYDPSIISIGFQGFGFTNKGINQIAKYVIKEFPYATIRLHIPFSYHGDPSGNEARQRVKEVTDLIQGTNITLEYDHTFMSDDEMVLWLSKNSVNCYFYDDTNLYGVASSPDYAMAARRPIAVLPTSQLRYIHHHVPSSDVTQHSLTDIIQNGFGPYEQLYNKMDPKLIVTQIDNILEQIKEK